MPDGLITPGPCPPEGCPPPTSIECIEVDRVYDLCFQQETRTRALVVKDPCVLECLCPRGPEQCPAGTIIPCLIQQSDSSCDVVNRVQQTGGFARVTLRVRVPVALFRVGTQAGTREPCLVRHIEFTKTVLLCAPEGTRIECRVSGDCRAIVTDGDSCRLDIEVSLAICVVIKAVAEVNLLVPTYGFCVPAECVTAGLGPCPPTPPAVCGVTPPPPVTCALRITAWGRSKKDWGCDVTFAICGVTECVGPVLVQLLDFTDPNAPVVIDSANAPVGAGGRWSARFNENVQEIPSEAFLGVRASAAGAQTVVARLSQIPRDDAACPA